MKAVIFFATILIGCTGIHTTQYFDNPIYNHQKEPGMLPQKIFVDKMFKPSLIYYNGEIIEMNLSKQSEKEQSVICWLNNRDFLLMRESSGDVYGNDYYDHLLLIDINKNVIDTIYSADISKGEIISYAYISQNDSLLLIKIKYNHHIRDTEGSFDFIVMDFKNKQIIQRLNNFYSLYFFQNLSNILSSDGMCFVYAISDERHTVAGSTYSYNLHKKKENGVYIFNLTTKEHLMIDKDGYDPTWSPRGDTIAYFNDTVVYLYNVHTQKKANFYKTKGNHSIVEICWSPDGEKLYILTREKTRRCPRGILTHRMVNVSTNVELVNGELSILDYTFCWK